MKKLILLGLAAALASSTANAQVLLQDNFNAENGGVGVLNYNPFTHWSVTGQVDLVANGQYGIGCNGLCVDLDGSAGPGKMTTKQAFSFGAGDRMRISFDISGNQRNSAEDNISLSILFGATPVRLPGYSSNIPAIGNGILDPNFDIFDITLSTGIFGNVPFSNWFFEFTALTAGSVQYAIGTSSFDQAGPILDNVTIERNVGAAVVTPEPSTWAMMSLGLGGMLAFARRRSRRV